MNDRHLQNPDSGDVGLRSIVMSTQITFDAVSLNTKTNKTWFVDDDDGTARPHYISAQQ